MHQTFVGGSFRTCGLMLENKSRAFLLDKVQCPPMVRLNKDYPLVLAPHTIMCMGVKSLLRRTGDLLRAVFIPPYSGRDLCQVTPVILHGVVSPDYRT